VNRKHSVVEFVRKSIAGFEVNFTHFQNENEISGI